MTTNQNANKVEYYGKVLIDLTNDNVTADKMLDGTTAHDKSGQIITGNIPNNGTISKEFDGIYTKSATIPAGYTSGGTVQLGNNIDEEVSDQADLIAQCLAALEGKVAGSSGEDVSAEVDVYTVELAEMETAVAVLETELAGKAAGNGSSLDTCTLTINCYPDYYAYILAYSVMVYDGSGISVVTGGDITASQFVVENVICGSFFGIKAGSGGYNASMSENIEFIEADNGEIFLTAFKISAPAGGNAIFSFTPVG